MAIFTASRSFSSFDIYTFIGNVTTATADLPPKAGPNLG